MEGFKVLLVSLITFLLTNNVFARDIIILKDDSKYEGTILSIYVDVLCDTNGFVVKFRQKKFVDHFKLVSSRKIKILKRREFLVYDYDNLATLNAKDVVDRFLVNERSYEKSQHMLVLRSKAIKGVKRYSLVLGIGIVSSIAAGIKFNKGYRESSNKKYDYYTEGGFFSAIAMSSFLHALDMRLSSSRRNKSRGEGGK